MEKIIKIVILMILKIKKIYYLQKIINYLEKDIIIKEKRNLKIMKKIKKLKKVRIKIIKILI